MFGASSELASVMEFDLSNFFGVDAVTAIMQELIFNEFGLRMSIHDPN